MRNNPACIPRGNGCWSGTDDINEATAIFLPLVAPLMNNKVTACSEYSSGYSHLSCYAHGEDLDLEFIYTSGQYAVEIRKLLVGPSHIDDYGPDYSPYFVQYPNTFYYGPTVLGGDEPVTRQQLEQAIDSQFEPYESDWDAFFNEPDFFLTLFILDPVPSVTGEAQTSTTTDGVTGETAVGSTSTDLDFTVTNPPSGIP